MPERDPSENRIVLRTRQGEDGSVLVEVEDNGAGMAPEVLQNLFTPFFTTKPRGIGTGLGLSICQRIVASIGGAIRAESALGRGTIVKVSLPATSTVPWTPLPAPPRQPPRKSRVLVIDDEPLIGALLRRILNQHEVV